MSTTEEQLGVEILLDRANRTFRKGETLSGKVVVRAPGKREFKCSDVLLRVKGTAATRIVGADDAKIFQLLDVSLLRRPSSFLPADRERKLEFEICLRQEDNEEESFLPETYKGVWINVEYKVTVEVKSAGLLSKSALASTEFFVERAPALSGMMGVRGRRRTFRLTKETVARSASGNRKRAALLAKAPGFAFSGRLDSDVLAVDGRPLSGQLVVEECAAPVAAVELQLLRVEATPAEGRRGGWMRRTSEVMTLQVAEGDLARGVAVPLHMVLPRRFVCESVELPGVFAIDFEVNVVVIFGKNFVVAENVPITILRHESGASQRHL